MGTKAVQLVPSLVDKLAHKIVKGVQRCKGRWLRERTSTLVLFSVTKYCEAVICSLYGPPSSCPKPGPEQALPPPQHCHPILRQ
jgi:hypothetical protein